MSSTNMTISGEHHLFEISSLGFTEVKFASFVICKL